MPAPVAKTSAPRASSVLSQEVTASTPAKPAPAGAPTSVATKAWVTLRRVFFTAADVGQAQKLYDILNRMQESVLQVLGVVSTNQLIPGNILRGIVFQAGETKYLAHGLGRAWQGYFVCRVASAGGVVLILDSFYPQGLTADMVLPIVSANSGTFDIYVF